MSTATITTMTQKGQVTIPIRIREFLGIRPNDKLQFSIDREDVKIKPVRTLEANFGQVQPTRAPEDFHAIRAMFEEQVGEDTAKEV